MTDYARPLSQVEIEAEIRRLSDELERQTDAFAGQCRATANAEADWKFALHRALVEVAARERPKKRDEKMTADERASQAALDAGEDLYRLHRIAEETQRATQAALGTLRSRLDSMRTLAANVRAQT